MNGILEEGSVLVSHERHSLRYFERVSQILIEDIINIKFRLEF